MKIFIYISILLSVSFVLPSFACEYANDQTMAQKKTTCLNQVGRDWSCQRNTCFNTGDTVKLRESFRACESMPKGDSRVECFDNVAYEHSDIKDLGDKSENLKSSNKKAVVDSAFFLMSYLQSKGASGGAKCLSRSLIKVASVAGLLSELKMRWTANSKFNQIKENYEDEQSEGGKDSYDAQVRAIQYLITEQEIIKQLAKERKSAYMFSAAAYSASSIVAIAETSGLKQPTCLGSPPASSMDGAPLPDGGGVDIGGKMEGFIGKFLKSSPGIAMMGALGAKLSYQLSSSAQMQYEDSKRNIVKLKSLVEKFESATAGYCTTEHREDLSKPECYCYEGSGDRNLNRSNSDICKSHWAKNSQNLMVAGGSYTTKLDIKKRVCMLKSGQIDPDCKCKQLLDSKNQNACKKVVMGTNSFKGFAKQVGIKSLFTNTNALTNGNIGFGEINSEKLAKAAARNRQILKGELLKLNRKRAELKRAPFEPLSDKVQNRFLRKVGLADITKHKMPNFKEISQDYRPPSVKYDDEEETSKEENSIQFTGSGKGSVAKKNSNNSSDDLFSSGQQTGQEFQDGENLADDEEYVLNDIENDKSKSLFEIISKRYNMTAVPILFGDKK